MAITINPVILSVLWNQSSHSSIEIARGIQPPVLIYSYGCVFYDGVYVFFVHVLKPHYSHVIVYCWLLVVDCCCVVVDVV